MSKKHLHNQAAIPLAPAVFKVRFFFTAFGDCVIYVHTSVFCRRTVPVVNFRCLLYYMLCDYLGN